jgi:hypothetical protein
MPLNSPTETIKMTTLAMLLLLTQMGFVGTLSLHAEDLEEGTSCAYPFSSDDRDLFTEENARELKPKTDSSKKESPNVWHGNLGKAKMTFEVKNTDFESQCKANWEKARKKNAPKKEEKSKSRKNREDDKKESHSPKAEFSIKWSSKD